MDNPVIQKCNFKSLAKTQRRKDIILKDTALHKAQRGLSLLLREQVTFVGCSVLLPKRSL